MSARCSTTWIGTQCALRAGHDGPCETAPPVDPESHHNNLAVAAVVQARAEGYAAGLRAVRQLVVDQIVNGSWERVLRGIDAALAAREPPGG